MLLSNATKDKNLTLRNHFYQRHTSTFSLNIGMNVSVHRDLNAAMSEKLRKRLDIKAESDTICSKSVTQAMKMN